MKFEDLSGDRHAELQLSLAALQGQVAHQPMLPLDLLAQPVGDLALFQQQLLLQQQQQFLHAQALLHGVHQPIPDALPLSVAPSLAIGLNGGAAAAAVDGPAPSAAGTPLVDPSVLARQQLRASAADSWREKKRRLANMHEAEKQGSADRDSVSPHGADAAGRGGDPGGDAAAAATLGSSAPEESWKGAGAPASGKHVTLETGKKTKLPVEKRKAESRRKRLLRNRVSAQMARERKRSYIQELEAQCQELENKNSTLEEQIDALAQENDGLRQMMKRKVRQARVDMEVPATEGGEEDGGVVE